MPSSPLYGPSDADDESFKLNFDDSVTTIEPDPTTYDNDEIVELLMKPFKSTYSLNHLWLR